MRIRQIALVARELEPSVGLLEDVLGVEVCFRDPGVALFGLQNALFPLGDSFLEVVSPVRADASAARLLERRGGDGGYMVILQCEELEKQRQRLEELSVRIVWETALDDIATIHLHPRDVGAAIVSLDEAKPAASWRWAGPGWEQKVRSEVVRGIVGAELQAVDPQALAARWSQVLAQAVQQVDGAWQMDLEGGRLRFVEAVDGRGEGLGGLEIEVADRGRVVDAARARGLPVDGDVVEICGTRFRLLG